MVSTVETAPAKRRDGGQTSTPEVSQEMLQILVDNIQEYAILTLDPEGRVTTWAPAAERLKGYKAGEIIGKHFSVFYTREDQESGKCQRELEAAARDGRFEDEGWRVRKDGSRFWANVVITALRDPKGNLKGFGKITRDMTERKQADERLRQQNRDVLEMATVPVVQVWEGILLVPLIGMLDSSRTQQLMERLLHRLTETSSQVALVDITGVPTIDTQTAQHLIETIKAVRYIGAEVVLTGVRPVIAQTLVHLGIDLSNATTRASLAAGLRVAFNLLNLRVGAADAAGRTELA
ncbi:MAG TPA: PAS domain S-box protein [Verrucomicrobiae bacterium]|jgi:PAS domain S-box-containing protein|nr:PAS domain S-box protein [Verrucomicrobiae bacterium]